MNLSTSTTNELTRLLAKVNYNASAVRLISYCFSSRVLMIYLGDDEMDNIQLSTRIRLSDQETTAILATSGIYGDFKWFEKADVLERLEAVSYIKGYLLKTVRVPQLKVA